MNGIVVHKVRVRNIVFNFFHFLPLVQSVNKISYMTSFLHIFNKCSFLTRFWKMSCFYLLFWYTLKRENTASLFDEEKKTAFGCKIELVLIWSLLIDEKGD